MSFLFNVADSTPALGGGIDEYTVLMTHFDGDQSDSNHTVTMNGDPQFSTVESKFGGSSIYFDGTDDYMSVTDSSDWAFGSGNFTFDCWFYSTGSQTTHAGIMGQNNNANTYQNIITVINENDLRWVASAYGIDVTGTTPFSHNQWNHLACVRNGTTATIYLNGISIGTDTFTDDVGNIDSPFYIGNRDVGVAIPFTGYIDEARVSNTARWTTNFSGSLPTEPYTSDANTKLLLHMNGDVSDGAHIVTAASNSQLNAVTTKWNGSLYLNGTNFFKVSDSDDWNFGSGDFTIDCWINASAYNTKTAIFSHGDVYGSFVCLLTTGPNRIIFGASASGSTWDFSTGWINHSMVVDSWHHLAVVRNGNNWSVYIDGSSIHSSSQSLTIMDSAAYFNVGFYYAGAEDQRYLTGYLDELRISKGIARWTANFTPETGPYTI